MTANLKNTGGISFDRERERLRSSEFEGKNLPANSIVLEPWHEYSFNKKQMRINCNKVHLYLSCHYCHCLRLQIHDRARFLSRTL